MIDGSTTLGPSSPGPGPGLGKTSASTYCLNGEYGPPLNLGQDEYLLVGQFTHAGPCGFPIFGSDLNASMARPTITGEVRQSIPDGEGGFFISGSFTDVDGVSRSGLARLKANGSLDEDFKPFGNLPKSPELENAKLALADGKLYVGGSFNSVSNPFGSVVNATTGASLWASGIRFNNKVLASTSDGAGGLYIAVSGSYQTTSAEGVIHLLADGSLDPNFQNRVYGNITVLAHDQANNVLYVGGSNLSSSGVMMSSILAYNATTGATITTWNPWLDPTYTDLTGIAVSATKVYATRVNSYNSPTSGLIAIDKSTGVISWQKSTTFRSGFYGVAFDGTYVHAVGAFTSVGGVGRNFMAKFDENGNLQANPASVPNSELNSVHYAAGYLYIGGRFTSVGATSAHGIARYNTSDMSLDTTWVPNPVNASTLGTVSGIVHDGASTLYVYGDFSAIGGKVMPGVAAITTTGAGTVKDLDLMIAGGEDAPVNTVAVGAGGVFVGGTFQSIGAPVIRSLAVLDSDSGDAEIFDSKILGGDVLSMTLSGDQQTLYLGGDFSSVKGQQRLGLASIRLSDLELTTWAPVTARGTFDEVRFIQEYAGNVYISGYFSQPLGLNMQVREDYATIDQAANVIPWVPALTSPNDITDFVIKDGVLYTMGRLSSGTNKNLAAYDLNNGGALMTLGRNFEGSYPNSLVEHNGKMYVASGADLVRLETDGTATVVKSLSGIIGTLGVSDGKLLVTANDLGGPDRNGMVIVNSNDGSFSSWIPSTPMQPEFVQINAAARIGDYLYIGGRGDNAMGSTVGKLLVANIKTGAQQILEVDGTVKSFEPVGEIMYVAGAFYSIDGQNRSNVASFTNGQLTNWQPEPDNNVDFIKHHQGVLYIGGEFVEIDGSMRQGLAAFDASTGALLAWDPFAGHDWGYFARANVVGNKIYIFYEAEKNGDYEFGLLTVQTDSMLVGLWPLPDDVDFDDWYVQDGKFYYWSMDSEFPVALDMVTGQTSEISWELSSYEMNITPYGIIWGQPSGMALMDVQTGKAKLVLKEVQGAALEM
ncbi:hypothetical protein Bdt_1202 [Bdellovibrio bacteriovorus str. Tiberius]|uniref:Uncharacterized protein n=1 Tax=Bdellovibrio bacteriovorus str. Tiberius TaxID=1069642 RepID=K7YM89_BDEBC|nr:hypothetical protein Bdt_1202 [Bdellovibrio bacteriovorus str. Tiberius]